VIGDQWLVVGDWCSVVDGWKVTVRGCGWLVVVVGWWLVVGGWWLVVGGWWLVVGGWWTVVGGWLVVRGSWSVVDWFVETTRRRRRSPRGNKNGDERWTTGLPEGRGDRRDAQEGDGAQATTTARGTAEGGSRHETPCSDSRPMTDCWEGRDEG
jgi:hypothetical protein